MSPGLCKRLEEIKSSLGRAKLVAVTKQATLQDIEETLQAGHRHLGENRISDLSHKAERFQSLSPAWHMIGQLQTNKISKLLKVPGLYAIHSVDSSEKLQKICNQAQAPLKLFLQVNLAQDPHKAGFISLQQVREACAWRAKQNSSPAEIHGLMSMAPTPLQGLGEEGIRKVFSHTRDWAQALKAEFSGWPWELSMGMSSDYALAVEYGSDWVRVGSKIYADS